MSVLRLLSELLDELECGDWTAEEFACAMLLLDGRLRIEQAHKRFPNLSQTEIQKIAARILGAPGTLYARVCDRGAQESSNARTRAHARRAPELIGESRQDKSCDITNHVMFPGEPEDQESRIIGNQQDSDLPGETRARKYNQRKPRAKKAPDEAQQRAQALKNAIAEALFKPPLERKHWALVNKLYSRLSEECGADFSLDNWREYVQDWQAKELGALSVPVALGVQSGFAAWLVRRVNEAPVTRQARVIVENGVRRIVYA